MLKTIGAALIACSAAGAGFWYAIKGKKYVTALETAMQAIMLLKSSITHRLMTLQDALEALSEQNSLLALLGVQKDPAQWSGILHQFGLKNEEVTIMMQLLQSIPKAAAGNCEHFLAAQELLSIRLDMVRKTVEQNSVLYPKLGLLCGAAVLLLLI